jgi:uncharacterized protein YjaZ
MTKKICAVILSLVMVLLVSSCDPNTLALQVELKNTPIPEVHFKRYEKTLFELPKDSFLAQLPALQHEFPLFLEGNLKDSLAIYHLQSFFTDPYMIELNDLVQQAFPNLSTVESELAKAMQHYSYYYKLPKTFTYYTYVSGLDIQYPVKVVDSNIVIGLDLYMGGETKAYALSGFPKYMSYWLKQESIVPDAMSELARGLMPEKNLSSPLIDQLVYEGKRLFFIQSMMPKISDSLLLHYRKSQMDWCYENEARLWSLLVENQFLFKNDVQMQKQFMDDGPFTSALSTEAPARLGQFIGWRLVSQYMARSGAQLPQLMAEKDAQKILKDSKYKPKR